MRSMKLRKRIIACACGLGMLLGVGGVVAKQYETAPVSAIAETTTEIGLSTGAYILNESAASRFRLSFNSPICDKNAGTAAAFQAGTLSDLNGLEDKLLIAGKTPTEWSNLDVGFSVSFRTSQIPVFNFDKTKLGSLGLNFFNGPFVVELKEDCVLKNDYGTVKAFAAYALGTNQWYANFCGTDEVSLSSRTEGPFYFEGKQGNYLQIKMWFAAAVVQKNGTTDVNISIDDMEGLQHALYFNGKSIAEWNAEGALGTITARSAGGFIFRFDWDKFDTSKAWVIELRKDVQTTKGVVQSFAYWVKPNFTFGNFKDSNGTDNGNGYVYQGKTLTFERTAFELNINNSNTLKMWFSDGTSSAPVISSDNGNNCVAGVTHLEGLQDVLKIDGKTLAEWETLLGDGFNIGSRASDGRFTPQFIRSALGENDFIGKNFVVELENDYMTSQGVVKEFKFVYNWALKQMTVNPVCETVGYKAATSFRKMDEFFYFDVTFDKDVINEVPTVDTPLSGDVLQKTDLSNLVKINGKSVSEAMYSVQALKDSKDTLRFSVLNVELSHNVKMELLKGYVFPNGNTLAEDVTLYYNEQNGTWQTEAMPDITIAYDANGGEGAMVGNTVEYGADYALAENTFIRNNYEFLGWSRTADGEVVFQDKENLHLYVGGSLENVNNTTLTLYAVWKKATGIKYVSVSTAGDIGLNFYVVLDDVDSATATVSMKDSTVTVDGVYQSDLDCWKFTYGVAAKDYKETVTLSVEGVTGSYSVQAYAANLPTDNGAYAFVSELIDYCEAARVYFAGEDAIATEALTADLSLYSASISGAQDGVVVKGRTLVCESKTTINVYIAANSLNGIDCTVDGNAVTPVAVEGQTGYYVLRIENIAAKDLDKTYTICIGGITLKCSALSYVKDTLANEQASVALQNVVKALYSLSVEAEKYFGGTENENV